MHSFSSDSTQHSCLILIRWWYSAQLGEHWNYRMYLESCRNSSVPLDYSNGLCVLCIKCWLKELLQILGKDNKIYRKYEENDVNAHQLKPGMFAPLNAKDLHLERCVRILPSHQDTGGFFICLIKKISELPKVRNWCKLNITITMLQGDNIWMQNENRSMESRTDIEPAAAQQEATKPNKGPEEGEAIAESDLEPELCRAYKKGKCNRNECKFKHEGPGVTTMVQPPDGALGDHDYSAGKVWWQQWRGAHSLGVCTRGESDNPES